MLHETSAREALAEMGQGRTQDEYIDLIWAQRGQVSRVSADGWPYRPSVGLVESKLRKIK
jgi:hypothetical protein